MGEAGGGAIEWGEGKMSQSERKNANGQAVFMCYSEPKRVSISELSNCSHHHTQGLISYPHNKRQIKHQS